MALLWHSFDSFGIFFSFFSIDSLDLTQGSASGHNPKETHANLRVGRILKARNKALVNHNLALSKNCEIGSGHKQNRKIIKSMKNVQPYELHVRRVRQRYWELRGKYFSPTSAGSDHSPWAPLADPAAMVSRMLGEVCWVLGAGWRQGHCHTLFGTTGITMV